jgi:hypothetical protein
VVDCDKQAVPSHLFTDGADQLRMIGEPCFVRQIVTEIALIENDASRAKIAKQRAIRWVKRSGRTQPDNEMVAYTCEIGSGHVRFFLGSDQQAGG